VKLPSCTAEKSSYMRSNEYHRLPQSLPLCMQARRLMRWFSPDSPNLEKVHSMSKCSFLWKKSYSVILSLRNIPSMHCSISQRFTYFTAFAPCAKNARKYSRVLARLTCRKISNLIQHTMNVATAQNYNSRKFGLKM